MQFKIAHQQQQQDLNWILIFQSVNVLYLWKTLSFFMTKNQRMKTDKKVIFSTQIKLSIKNFQIYLREIFCKAKTKQIFGCLKHIFEFKNSMKKQENI